MDHAAVKILIVDDDEVCVMAMKRSMKKMGLHHPVRVATDGLHALDVLRGEAGEEKLAPPYIVLLDINMPRMDGRTALEEIRKDPILKRIPVVFLTTSQAEEDILRTYDLGVNSFITKPVTFDGLVQVVQVLNRYWIEIVALPEVA